MTAVGESNQQQAAVKALKTAGYDPETGEDRISKLIEKSTSGRLQGYTAEALRFVGISTSGMNAINDLTSTSNQISLDILGGKLGANISNTDRDFIVGILGDVANYAKPAEERLAAWNAARNRMIVSGMLPPPTKGAGQAPAATPSPAPAGGGVSVKAPNGQTFIFPTQQAADDFKKKAGIK